MDIYQITSQEVLERISRHCPEALTVYLNCLNRTDEKGNVFFTKEMVEIQMSENWRAFKNNIKKLARENLLFWVPIDNGIAVNMITLDDADE